MAKKDDGLVIGLLSDEADTELITTGVPELDALIGGFPRGRLVEIWGATGIGKTHLACQIMAEASNNSKVLFIDSEFALNKERVKELGAEPKNIAYIANSELEKVCELIVAEVAKNEWDYIILDSLAQLTPLAVANAEIGERSIGLFALLIKHWILKLRPLLAHSKTVLIVMNQYRPPIGLYVSEEPPGGKAFHHACDIRIKLSSTSGDKVIKDKQLLGHWVNCVVKKNRLGAPGLETKFKINY